MKFIDFLWEPMENTDKSNEQHLTGRLMGNINFNIINSDQEIL